MSVKWTYPEGAKKKGYRWCAAVGIIFLLCDGLILRFAEDFHLVLAVTVTSGFLFVCLIIFREAICTILFNKYTYALTEQGLEVDRGCNITVYNWQDLNSLGPSSLYKALSFSFKNKKIRAFAYLNDFEEFRKLAYEKYGDYLKRLNDQKVEELLRRPRPVKSTGTGGRKVMLYVFLACSTLLMLCLAALVVVKFSITFVALTVFLCLVGFFVMATSWILWGESVEVTETALVVRNLFCTRCIPLSDIRSVETMTWGTMEAPVQKDPILTTFVATKNSKQIKLKCLDCVFGEFLKRAASAASDSKMSD